MDFFPSSEFSLDIYQREMEREKNHVDLKANRKKIR